MTRDDVIIYFTTVNIRKQILPDINTILADVSLYPAHTLRSLTCLVTYYVSLQQRNVEQK